MIDVMLISFFILFLLTLFPSFPFISSFDNLFFLAIKEDGSVLTSAYVSIKGNLCSNSTDLVWGFNRHLYGMIYTPARNRKAQNSILKRFSVFCTSVDSNLPQKVHMLPSHLRLQHDFL